MERDTRVQGHAAGDDGRIPGRSHQDADGLSGFIVRITVEILAVIVHIAVTGCQDTETSEGAHKPGSDADGAADDELAAGIVLLPGTDDRFPVDFRADQVDEFRIRQRPAHLVGKPGAVAVYFGGILGAGILCEAQEGGDDTAENGEFLHVQSDFPTKIPVSAKSCKSGSRFLCGALFVAKTFRKTIFNF